MAILIEFEGRSPRVADDAYVAPTAVLIGDVTVGPGASVWFGAILRGDFGRIEVGPGSNVQDNAVLHTSEVHPTVVGADVTIGHLSTLEGCRIEDGALIGMGSVLLQGAVVGAGSMVAAGSVVGEGFEIPAGMLAAGTPARIVKPLDGSSRHWVETAAADYAALRLRYLTGSRTRDEVPEGTP